MCCLLVLNLVSSTLNSNNTACDDTARFKLGSVPVFHYRIVVPHRRLSPLETFARNASCEAMCAYVSCGLGEGEWFFQLGGSCLGVEYDTITVVCVYVGALPLSFHMCLRPHRFPPSVGVSLLHNRVKRIMTQYSSARTHPTHPSTHGQKHGSS